MDAGALHAVLRARVGLFLGERRGAVNGRGDLWHFLFVGNGCFLSALYRMCISFLFICIICFHRWVSGAME